MTTSKIKDSAPPESLLDLEGLGKDLWDQALAGEDAADYIADEREAWGDRCDQG
jgi:hypothetical protein